MIPTKAQISRFHALKPLCYLKKTKTKSDHVPSHTSSSVISVLDSTIMYERKTKIDLKLQPNSVFSLSSNSFTSHHFLIINKSRVFHLSHF